MPSIDILYKLCLILNKSADYLLGLEDDFGNKVPFENIKNLNKK